MRVHCSNVVGSNAFPESHYCLVSSPCLFLLAAASPLTSFLPLPEFGGVVGCGLGERGLGGFDFAVADQLSRFHCGDAAVFPLHSDFSPV